MTVVGLVIAWTIAASCSSNSGDETVRAGSPQSGGARSTAKPAPSAVAPPPFDEAQARYEAALAPAGQLVGRASATTVDDVALRSAVRISTARGVRSVDTARRIRITGGPFPYGDARVLVLVDGRSVGEGLVSDGGGSLAVAVLDAALIQNGAVIAYQVEPRPPVTVGTLRTGG
jgi:hypothetical protein